MKIVVKCVVILSCAIGALAQAGVAEDISTPVIKDIRFSYHSIALITERETYIFDRKTEPTRPHPSGYGLEQPHSGIELARPHRGALINSFLASSGPQKQDERLGNPNGDFVTATNWVTEGGTKFQSLGGYCGEGSEDYHLLLYKAKELNTYLPGCESISDMLLLDLDQLWIGSYEQHEYGFGAGSGVRVISLKSKKLIAAYSPKQKSMTGYVPPLNFDASTGKLSIVKKAAAGRANDGKIITQSRGLLADGFVKFIRPDVTTPQDVWVLTATALHRIIHGKVTERWYLSEQLNSDGQVTLLASLKPQKSNPWAMLVRHTKLKDSKPIWNQLKLMPQLAKRLTYEYDELGDHFKLDGKLFNPSGGFVYDEYRFTAQEIIDELKNRK